MIGRAALFCVWAGSLAADPAALAAINVLRIENGRSALLHDRQLEAAALSHARDMARTGFFAHEGSDGSSVADRVRRAGYRWCGVAENIAQGHRDVAEVLAGWMASPGHRRNLLKRDFEDVALVEGPDRIWVMVLARGC